METAVNENSTRPFKINERIRDVGGDSESSPSWVHGLAAVVVLT